MGKSENSGFSETIAASGIKQMDLMKICEYCIEGQGHFLTLAQGHVHTKIQAGFSQKILC